MNDLERARETINRVDAEMARLFEERMHACETIAAYKKAHGLPMRDAAREAEVLGRARALLQSPELAPYYVRFLKSAIDLSCEYQTRLLRGSPEAPEKEARA